LERGTFGTKHTELCNLTLPELLTFGTGGLWTLDFKTFQNFPLTQGTLGVGNPSFKKKLPLPHFPGNGTRNGTGVVGTQGNNGGFTRNRNGLDFKRNGRFKTRVLRLTKLKGFFKRGAFLFSFKKGGFKKKPDGLGGLNNGA